MKEAAGEANMTVITIVLIGVVAAVGLLLVPRLMKNAKSKACCTDAGWFVSGNKCCDPADASGSKCTGNKTTLGSEAMKTATTFKDCMED